MEFDDVLKARRSCRDYSIKKVNFSDIIAICDAARLAPMAGNIYTIHLILVSEKKKRIELAEAALDQEFIAQAPYVIVVCSDITQILRSYGERGRIYVRQQAGAAIENMLLKTVDLGLSSCWVGAFDENAIKRILGIPDNIHVEALLSVGYARDKVSAKTKPELKHILHFEKWGIKATIPERRESPFKR